VNAINRKRQKQINDPALKEKRLFRSELLFLLRSLEPTRATNPVPKRSTVAGSGTGSPVVLTSKLAHILVTKIVFLIAVAIDNVGACVV